jgi:hypothetical protein
VWNDRKLFPAGASQPWWIMLLSDNCKTADLRTLEELGDARKRVLVPGGGVSSLTSPRACGISKFNVFMEPKEYSHPIKSLLTIRFQLS